MQLVKSLLSSHDDECILSAITTLIFLTTHSSKAEILTSEFISHLIHLSNSTNKRIKNLATVFLTDYCDAEEVMKLRQSIEASTIASTSSHI